MNKKGNVFDGLRAGWIYFGLTFIVIIFTIILSNYSTSIGNNFNDTQVIGLVNTAVSNYINVMDYALLMILVLFLVLSIIAARFIKTSNVYLVFGIIALVFIAIGGAAISDIHTQAYNDVGVWHDAMNNYPITRYILDHFMIVTIIYEGIILVILYGRRETT